MPQDDQPPRIVLSTDDIVARLKRENPNERAYLYKRKAGGFFFNEASLKRSYERLIREEAVNRGPELTQKWSDDATAPARAEAAKLAAELAEQTAHQLRLKTAAQLIAQLPAGSDYVDLTSENRSLLSELFRVINGKPLDSWQSDEKLVFKFWRELEKYPEQGISDKEPSVSPSELRSFMQLFLERNESSLLAQHEIIRLLSLIRWGIAGISMVITLAWISSHR